MFLVIIKYSCHKEKFLPVASLSDVPGSVLPLNLWHHKVRSPGSRPVS